MSRDDDGLSLPAGESGYQLLSGTITTLAVIQSFKNLGYIDPKEIKLRYVPGYVLVLPPVSQDDTDKDIESLDKRISDSKAAGSKFAKPNHGCPNGPLYYPVVETGCP